MRLGAGGRVCLSLSFPVSLPHSSFCTPCVGLFIYPIRLPTQLSQFPSVRSLRRIVILPGWGTITATRRYLVPEALCIADTAAFSRLAQADQHQGEQIAHSPENLSAWPASLHDPPAQ